MSEKKTEEENDKTNQFNFWLRWPEPGLSFLRALIFSWIIKILGETLKRKKKKRRKIFSKSVFHPKRSLSPSFTDCDNERDPRMTKSMNEGTTLGSLPSNGGDNNTDVHTPTILVIPPDDEHGDNDDNDHLDTDDPVIDITILSDTLSKCFLPQSSSLSSSVYGLAKGKNIGTFIM